MGRVKSVLDHVRIAKPCSSSWADMTGDNRVRFCAQCKLNVYNLSDMTRGQAERLIHENQGRLCVQYYMRHDGTIITKDCPVGWQRMKQGLLRLAYAFAAVVALTAVALGWHGASGNRFSLLRHIEPFASIVERFRPSPPIQLWGAMVGQPNIRLLPPNQSTKQARGPGA